METKEIRSHLEDYFSGTELEEVVGEAVLGFALADLDAAGVPYRLLYGGRPDLRLDEWQLLEVHPPLDDFREVTHLTCDLNAGGFFTFGEITVWAGSGHRLLAYVAVHSDWEDTLPGGYAWLANHEPEYSESENQGR